jgi:ketosteroid isomerase-like protein
MHKLGMIALGALLCTATAVAAGTPPQPPAAMLKLAALPVGVANTNDASGLAGAFTSDGLVVDENPPFEWRGANAGTAWWKDDSASFAAGKLTHIHVTAASAPSEYRLQGNAAYLILPMHVTAKAGGKPFESHGAMTYTFRKVSGAWKISTMFWTNFPSAPAKEATIPAEIAKLLELPADLVNTADGSIFAGRLTDDAVVADEAPSFEWRGAGAGQAWWADVQKLLVAYKTTHLRGAASAPTEFVRQGDGAYAIMPLTLTATETTGPFREPGYMTYTFRKAGGAWKVSSLVWTTAP